MNIAARRAERNAEPHSQDIAQEKGSGKKSAKRLLVRVSLDRERVVFLLVLGGDDRPVYCRQVPPLQKGCHLGHVLIRAYPYREGSAPRE